MRIWLDAQISPLLASWLRERFGVEAEAVRDLGHLESDDLEIFTAAHEAKAVVMTKDSDFVRLVETRGSPPQVIWITCGNTSRVRALWGSWRVFKNTRPRCVRAGVVSGRDVF